MSKRSGEINPETWRQLEQIARRLASSAEKSLDVAVAGLEEDDGDDDDGSAGDREPRNPLPVAPQAGAIAVELGFAPDENNGN